MIVYRQRFAIDTLPFNYAISVGVGMDFIIKTVQLSIEKHITAPQSAQAIPSRAIVFLDLKNMFNNSSCKKLLQIIEENYPELLAIAHLLYETPGQVHYHWKDRSWHTIAMQEGVNQGYPLSSLFATLVFLRILCPLNTLMASQAALCLTNNDSGGDYYGSITHLFGYLDNVTAAVPPP